MRRHAPGAHRRWAAATARRSCSRSRTPWNPGTHSLITGLAPVGATLKLERTGVFPLWDGSMVADTVATAMTTASTGAFSYHTNPSTRPFVQSRKATALGAPKDTLSTSGTALPLSSSDTLFEVTEAADVLTATLTHTVPTGDDTLRNMDLVLLDPSGAEVARTDEFAQVSKLAWTGPDGQGVPAGTYTLRVENTAGVVPAYTLEAATADVLPVTTPRQFEQWTLTCITANGIAGQRPSASSAARRSTSATSARPASRGSTQASARKFTPEFLAEAATSPVVVTRCRQPGARPS